MSKIVIVILLLTLLGCSKNGEYIEYYDNGNIERREIFEDGKSVFFEKYYENGGKEYLHKLPSTINDSLYTKTFFPSSRTKLYMPLDSLDRKHGEVIHYYESGNIEQIVNWRHGREHGAFFVYSDSITLLRNGFYHFGVKDSNWFWYGDDGILDSTEIYSKLGKKLGVIQNQIK